MTALQLSLSIDAPSARPRMPQEPIVRSAEIEDGYRWVLRRAWGPGPCILWCGLNPSTADGTRDDPTMLREIGFSFRWGFGSLVKVNIYPFIASAPADMRAWRKTWEPDIYAASGMRPWSMDRSSYSAWMHNIGVVRDELARSTQYVAAWGNGTDPVDLKQFLGCVQLCVDDEEHGLVRVPVAWHCLGKTLDGSPKHTLARGVHRIPDDAKPVLWREARQ